MQSYFHFPAFLYRWEQVSHTQDSYLESPRESEFSASVSNQGEKGFEISDIYRCRVLICKSN